MEKTITIWSRLGHWLRLNDEQDERKMLGIRDETVRMHAGTEPESADLSGRDGERLPGAMSRWTRRDHTLQRLQEGHERLVDAFTAVQRHFENMDRRGEEIAGSLREISATLRDAPAESKKHADLLSTIASELAEANERSGVLAESVQSMPNVVQKQEETLATLNDHLATAGKTDVRMASVMDSFGGTLGTVRDASSAQLETLKEMQEATRKQQENLTSLLSDQNGQIRIFLAILLTFGILATAAAGVIGWLLWSRPG